MIPSFIFLFIALISGAGASIAYAKYKQTKPLQGLPPPPDDYKQDEQVKGRDLKKAVEEAVKPHLEQTTKLEKKLANAETLIQDLKTAARLAPEPTVPDVPAIKEKEA
jgi:hypothetical protein